MAVMTFPLVDGYKFGEDVHHNVGLRELTTEDLIDAQIAAEKVIIHEGKALSYTSDVLYGLEMLCRQIEFIGAVKGPFTMKELRKLSNPDFTLVQEKAQELDDMILEELKERGRSEGASGA
ncbi:phage tail assembly protein [Vibrio hepatarius]|uniref:phage tail assembly protein n=1 Tax=Vibrio hepatarius TaxID=171383 RepID=UPI00148D822C|nr:phage tail assembly protein [Vibrio hepatarius]NOI14839.1 hypothetical protein [Vibrio hepatarius]